MENELRFGRSPLQKFRNKPVEPGERHPEPPG
jgi:hypothetical protein